MLASRDAKHLSMFSTVVGEVAMLGGQSFFLDLYTFMMFAKQTQQ